MVEYLNKPREDSERQFETNSSMENDFLLATSVVGVIVEILVNKTETR